MAASLRFALANILSLNSMTPAVIGGQEENEAGTKTRAETGVDTLWSL